MANGHQRAAAFDILKGIAIFMVVMGHVLTMCIRGVDGAVAFKLIGEIHMPVFFFISGYFTYKISGKRDFVSPALWRRFKQLVVPFFVVSSLWILYFPHSKLQSPLSSSVPDMLRSYWKDGYWFTLTLFELNLLYALAGKLLSAVKSPVLQAVYSVAVYVALIFVSPLVSDADANCDPLGVGLLTRFYPVFMMGVFAKKYAGGFRRLAENPWCFFVASGAAFCCWYYSSYWWEFPGISGTAIYVAQPLLHAGLMLVAFGLVYGAGESAERADGNVVKRCLVLLGKNSLGIYLLHYFFLFPLTPLQEPLRAVGLAFVPTVVIAAFFAFSLRPLRRVSFMRSGKIGFWHFC